MREVNSQTLATLSDPPSLSLSRVAVEGYFLAVTRGSLPEPEWPADSFVLNSSRHKSLFTKRFMTGQHFSSGHTHLLSAMWWWWEKDILDKSFTSPALQFFVYEVNRCKIKKLNWKFYRELFWAQHLMKSLFKVRFVKSKSIISRKLKASLSSLWLSKTLKPKHFSETVFTSSISFLSSHNSIIICWSPGHRPRCNNY